MKSRWEISRKYEIFDTKVTEDTKVIECREAIDHNVCFRLLSCFGDVWVPLKVTSTVVSFPT